MIPFQKQIEKELSKLNPGGNPPRLYDPIRYMIGLGGKRLRPALLLMSHELFNGDADQLMKPALGIEPNSSGFKGPSGPRPAASNW